MKHWLLGRPLAVAWTVAILVTVSLTAAGLARHASHSAANPAVPSLGPPLPSPTGVTTGRKVEQLGTAIVAIDDACARRPSRHRSLILRYAVDAISQFAQTEGDTGFVVNGIASSTDAALLAVHSTLADCDPVQAVRVSLLLPTQLRNLP